MGNNDGVLKRTYNIVALFAILNLLGLGGGAAYLVGSGAIEKDKIREIVAMLLGDEEPSTDEEEVPESKAPISAGIAAAQVDNADLGAQMDVEILHREAERIKVELDQRLALNNSILLKVRTEREAFQTDRDNATQKAQAEADKRRDVGFEKQVAIIESLKPTIAVKHLLGISDPDEAAIILMAIKTDKARKIVEAAGRGEDLIKMQVVMQRIRETAPNRSARLNQGGQ